MRTQAHSEHLGVVLLVTGARSYLKNKLHFLENERLWSTAPEPKRNLITWILQTMLTSRRHPIKMINLNWTGDRLARGGWTKEISIIR